MTNNKKVLVLISEGGGGHKAAGESLREILGGHYHVEVANTLSDVVPFIDRIATVTFSRFTSEDLYNFFLKKGFHRVIKYLFCRFGPIYLRSQKKLIKRNFEKYLAESHTPPALIISTMPMLNDALFQAAHGRNIPYVILPTDLDSTIFMLGMKKVKVEEKAKLLVALPYDDPELHAKVGELSTLQSKHLLTTGFPVRPACEKKYSPAEIGALKEKHGMEKGRKSITLVMGAEGGDTLFTYAKEIAQLKLHNLELNVCVGRNRSAAEKIIAWVLENGGTLVRKEGEIYTTLLSKENVLIHVRGFTKEIIEIMAASDLLITKTGSCSVNEGIYLGKKMLLDNTKRSSARHVLWETYNVSFVQKHGLGDAFANLQELKEKISLLLEQPTLASAFPRPPFQENILSVVHRLLG